MSSTVLQLGNVSAAGTAAVPAAKLEPLVIPVRYVARGDVVHATSTALSTDVVQVRSVVLPHTGSAIDVKLFFPGAGVVSQHAVVSQAMGDQFRATFTDCDEFSRQRLYALLYGREVGTQRSQRFHTYLKAIVREPGRTKAAAFVSNLSRTGAFVRLETLPARGRVVEIDLEFPGEAVHESVNAFVVHVAPGRGIGVQFIGASEAFKSRLEQHLAQLSH